jgi:uncharacterized membrane protein
MKRIFQYFLRGLLIIVPAGLTVLVLVYILRGLDRVFGSMFKITKYPGVGLFVGLVLTLGLVTLVGFLASNFIGRRFFGLVDRIFKKVPLVKMLYGAIRDLVEAFAGEKKKFDKPVVVSFGPGGSAKAIGFITRQDLEILGLEDHVAVYLPQSYNFAGNVLVFPKEAVRPVDINSAEAMTFIVSGGVAGQDKAGETNK